MIISNINPTENQPYRIFGLRQNWDTAFRTSWEFKTDLLQSGNGKEQRRAIRYEPRRSFTYNCLYKDSAKYQLDRFFDQSPGKLAWMPEENKTLRSKGGMAGDSFGMNYYGPAPAWMQIGQTVILNDKGNAETRVIDSFSDSTIRFTEKNDTVFSADTTITYAVLCRPDAQTQSQRLISSAGTLSFSAAVDPGSEIYSPGTDGQYFIGFREYMHWPIDWGNAPNVTHQWNHDDIDYGFGRVKTYVPQDFPNKVYQASYWRSEYSNVMELVDFFCRMRGMAREFFLPSYERQIPYSAIAQATKAIIVPGLDFAYTYKDSTVYRRIVIRKKTGEDIHAQVDFVEALPDTNTSVIWLTENLPDTPVSPNDTYGIWWVTVARFAVDRIDVDWLTNTVGQLQFTFQNLENFDV